MTYPTLPLDESPALPPDGAGPDDGPHLDEPRCANCNRRVRIGGPYAICARCEDELNGGPR